jgi:hypothetical protein
MRTVQKRNTIIHIENDYVVFTKYRNVTPKDHILHAIDPAAGLEYSRTCVHRLVRFGTEVEKGWKPFDVWK